MIKYADIKLCSNDKIEFRKINDKLINDFYEIKKRVNLKLAEAVKYCSDNFDISSGCQGYMIYLNDNGLCPIGIILIMDDDYDDDIEVRLQFDKELIFGEKELMSFVKDIIESLGYYFYEKDKIYFQLFNDVSLDSSYDFEISQGNDKLYSQDNLYNKILPKIIYYMKKTEKFMSSKGSYYPKYHDLDDHIISEQVALEYATYEVPTEEIFNHAKGFSFEHYLYNGSDLSVKFTNDGGIFYEKKTGNPEDKYENTAIECNLNNNEFSISKDYVGSDSSYFISKTDKRLVACFIDKNMIVSLRREDNQKLMITAQSIMNLQEPFNMRINLVVTDDEMIDYCEISFSSYKDVFDTSEQSRLMTYILSIDDNGSSLSFKPCKQCKGCEPEKVLLGKMDGGVNLSLLDDIILKTIEKINQHVTSFNTSFSQKITVDDINRVIRRCNNIIKDTCYYNELPYLKDILIKNFETYEKVKQL